MSPRTISSSLTFFWKYIMPFAWITGMGLGACVALFGVQSGAWTSHDRRFFLAFWIGGSVFLSWFGGRLKWVRLDGDSLLVSNYRTEVRIPLTEIANVTQDILWQPSTITIHLRNASPMGKRIVFIAESAWFFLSKEHPLVDELLKFAKKPVHRG